MFFKTKRIHFAGIGGAGMYPMAELMLRRGHRISGSDLQQSNATRRLESLGVTVQYHHEPDLVKQCDILVYSSAVRSGNPELVYAWNQGILCMKRAEMLGDIMRTCYNISIAGTHGKTTTTALMGKVFADAGMDPTVIVGGTYKDSESNVIVGDGDLLISEADEYDRSFLKMLPTVAIITNIEEDHLDIYKDIDEIRSAFIEYAKRIPFYGMVLLCADDAESGQIRRQIGRQVITYGVSEHADYRASGITTEKGFSRFDVLRGDTVLGSIELPLLGLHNVRNALAVLAVAGELGLPFEICRKSLAGFRGMKRRFEIIGVQKGITVVDDYAHHPTEIRATLSTAKNSGFKRIIAVFQPHLYTRTRDFLNGFAESLCSADVALVTEIYKAREEPIPGVNSAAIVDKMKKTGHCHAQYVTEASAAVEALLTMVRPGDGVIFMGAGDIWKSCETLLQRIQHG